jgi:hypothetical protein
MLASLACVDILSQVSASPTQQLQYTPPRAATTVTGVSTKLLGAELSAGEKLLVNQIITQQRGTGLKWDGLTAEALLKLLKTVETSGWPSATCRLDNVSIRREW